MTQSMVVLLRYPKQTKTVIEIVLREIKFHSGTWLRRKLSQTVTLLRVEDRNNREMVSFMRGAAGAWHALSTSSRVFVWMSCAGGQIALGPLRHFVSCPSTLNSRMLLWIPKERFSLAPLLCHNQAHLCQGHGLGLESWKLVAYKNIIFGR